MQEPIEPNIKRAPQLDDGPPPYFQGRKEWAEYHKTGVERYADNPLIEALPPILTDKEVSKQLACYPEHDENQRKLPDEVRIHLTHTALDLFVPLPDHLDLAQRFSCLIRNGYVPRNPITAAYWKEINTRLCGMTLQHRRRSPVRSTATGFNIIGISGGGKTTGTEVNLDLYPQVIHHRNYQNRNFNFVQVVWLKMLCPPDGSIRGLCLDFFRILDDLLGTHHYRTYAEGRKTIDELIPSMARVASMHAIGVLAFDEIQFLSEIKSGGKERMLNLFCELTNRIGLPIVFIGTYKARQVLEGEFRQVRRGCGEGEKRWDRLTEARTWRFFLTALWRYQYVAHPTALTDELSDLFYDLTQGIPDLCVKLYILVQVRAIRTGKEVITAEITRSVAQDSFGTVQRILDHLRKNDTAALELISDISPIDLDASIRAMDKISQSTSLLDVLPRADKKNSAAASVAPQPSKSDSEAKKNSPQKVAEPPEGTAEELGVLKGVAVGDGNLSPYDRLKAKGFIRPGTEFLKEEAVA
jgi:hypothetical protein